MDKILDDIWAFVVSIGGKILLALIVLIIGHFVIKYVMKLINRSKKPSKIDKTIKNFMNNFVKTALYCILIISVIAILGIPMTSIVTVLASAGVAIGLAVQGALGNFAGGMMIIIFKPFELGDYVEAGGSEGTVSNIGLLYTTLLTIDNKKITLPNSSISGGKVTNYSSEETRRVDIVFTVAYGSDIAKVKEIVGRVAAAHPFALKEPEPFVRLTNHLDSSLEITSRTWCKSSDYWTLKFDITEQVNKAFAENGIEIPFPQVDVHMKQ